MKGNLLPLTVFVLALAACGRPPPPEDDLMPLEGRLAPGPMAFTPCGGDLEGTYRATDVGYTAQNPDIVALQQACPGVRVIDHVTADGAFSLVGGAFSRQVAMVGDYKIFLPNACVSSFGADSCDSLSAVLSDELEFPTTCSQVDQNTCRCIARFDRNTLYFNHFGAYTTSGTQLTLKSTSPREVHSWDYCVTGDTLAIETGGFVDVYQR